MKRILAAALALALMVGMMGTGWADGAVAEPTLGNVKGQLQQAMKMVDALQAQQGQGGATPAPDVQGSAPNLLPYLSPSASPSPAPIPRLTDGTFTAPPPSVYAFFVRYSCLVAVIALREQIPYSDPALVTVGVAADGTARYRMGNIAVDVDPASGIVQRAIYTTPTGQSTFPTGFVAFCLAYMNGEIEETPLFGSQALYDAIADLNDLQKELDTSPSHSVDWVGYTLRYGSVQADSKELIIEPNAWRKGAEASEAAGSAMPDAQSGEPNLPPFPESGAPPEKQVGPTTLVPAPSICAFFVRYTWWLSALVVPSKIPHSDPVLVAGWEKAESGNVCYRVDNVILEVNPISGKVQRAMYLIGPEDWPDSSISEDSLTKSIGAFCLACTKGEIRETLSWPGATESYSVGSSFTGTIARGLQTTSSHSIGLNGYTIRIVSVSHDSFGITIEPTEPN